MRGARFDSLRRVAAVAHATRRDLFSGRGVALAILLAAAWWFALADPRAATANEAAVLLLERRMTLLAVVASAAALLAGAHAAGEDRRVGSFESWRITPLRASEALLGRWLGVTSGLALGVAPLFAWIVLLAPGCLRSHRDELAPRPRFLPLQIERTLADGSRQRWQRGPALLDPGERLVIDFAATTEPVEIVVPWATALRSGGAAPADFTLQIGERLWRPAAGESLATWKIALPAGPPMRAEWHSTATSAIVRVELDEVVLRGAPRAWWPTLVRLIAGGVAEIGFAAALGIGLATWVGELLACAGGALLLLLANLRALFEAVASAAADPHAPLDEGARWWAHRFEQLFFALPDLVALRAVERTVAAAPPWQTSDRTTFALAGAVAAAVLWLARARLAHRSRGAP